MPGNLREKDLKVPGYVLRRTNYGEADRILNITPVGKVSAIAKGVRKEKSKLAGGVEMLTRSDYVIHFGKSEMGVVTSAKMVKYYGGLLNNYDSMEFIGKILKEVNRAAEESDTAEFYSIVEQCLKAIENGMKRELVEAWFVLNLERAMGEQMNLYRDVNGVKLSAEEHYVWDSMERAFRAHAAGEFGVNEIKLMRLIIAIELEAVGKVKVGDEVVRKVCELCKMNKVGMI